MMTAIRSICHLLVLQYLAFILCVEYDIICHLLRPYITILDCYGKCQLFGR